MPLLRACFTCFVKALLFYIINMFAIIRKGIIKDM